MNVLSLISIGVAAALFAEPFVRSRTAKKRMNEVYEKEREEYRQKVEYNRTHLPSKELPPLSPDLDKLEKVIVKSSGLALKDVGDEYACLVVYASENYKRHIIPKSELDDDTIKLIDLILKDIDWFYGHHTGCTAGECGTVLENFLREKYPMLSAESISRIGNRYCINDR